jgi:hypothetical protein
LLVALTIPLSFTIASCAGDPKPAVEIGEQSGDRRLATAVEIPPRPPECRRVGLRPLGKGENMHAAHAWRTGEAEALNDRLEGCGDAWDRMRARYAAPNATSAAGVP